MNAKLSFLHTADLHLGAPMRGFCGLDGPWEARLRRALCESFDRVVETALARKVDFVVIAGDSFDTSGASFDDHVRFFEGLQRLDDAEIPVYLVPGNHDPFSSWKADLGKLPVRARMMGGEGPEFALFERGGHPLCLIAARGYRNQAWPLDEPICEGLSRSAAVAALRAENLDAGEAPFCVGIVHTGLDLDQSKAYADPDRLLAADVDYWACGHLHRRLVRPSETKPRIVFPGCIQGRDLRESGERGCYVVTLEGGGPTSAPKVDLEFVPTASVVFHTLEVDVGACRTLADVTRLVQAQLFAANGKAGCDEMVVRVVLQGRTDLHRFLCRADVIRDLRKRLNNAYPTFFCDALVDRTRPAGGTLETDDLFAGQVARIAAEQQARPDEMVDYVQAELVRRGIDVPDSLASNIGEYNAAAAVLVADLLEGLSQ